MTDRTNFAGAGVVPPRPADQTARAARVLELLVQRAEAERSAAAYYRSATWAAREDARLRALELDREAMRIARAELDRRAARD